VLAHAQGQRLEPLENWKALKGLMHEPVSRSSTTRARMM
jgi:hypothetical protein